MAGGGRSARRGARRRSALTLSEALGEHPPERRAARVELGRGQGPADLGSPAVADLAWASRRLELRLLRTGVRGGLPAPARERAARELLAVQSSDWAFMDHRGQAGDYPFGARDRAR